MHHKTDDKSAACNSEKVNHYFDGNPRGFSSTTSLLYDY